MNDIFDIDKTDEEIFYIHISLEDTIFIDNYIKVLQKFKTTINFIFISSNSNPNSSSKCLAHRVHFGFFKNLGKKKWHTVNRPCAISNFEKSRF